MTRTLRFLLALVVLAALGALPLAATCGGGGGGGMGGVRRSGGPAEGVETAGRRDVPGPLGAIYQVPWAVVHTGEEVPAPLAAPAGAPSDNLVVYWFPRTQLEAKSSDLQASRELTLLTARCVTLALVASDNAELRGRFRGGTGPYVVLAEAGGKELGRVAADSGPHLKAAQVEKLVSTELKSREAGLDRQLAAAHDKEGHGDREGAVALYQQVWAARCLVPGKIPKKAAEALKKLGHPVPPDTVGWMGSRPAPAAAAVERTLAAGLTAEDAGRYLAARALYARAHRFDPADPVPLRYLGELYRHHTGDWVAARRTFEQILAMPADPISRAVALHGLGKMTIHAGDFARGLALIEQSVATYPLPLAYRNLAVYWNSEGQVEKAQHLAEKALALDPDDPYTQIFVAAFIAEDGRREEALRIAHAHEDLLAASYNLAAIHSLLGHRREALALLHRHFYDYERFDAVRAKEMKEAREDIVFTALKDDPEFIALTAGAETTAQAAQAQAMPGAKAMP